MKKTMKPGHRYFVINIDEPYAKAIYEVLKAGQMAKGQWPEGDIPFETWVEQTWTNVKSPLPRIYPYDPQITIERLAVEKVGMLEALEWYEDEKIRDCRKVTREGDEARHDLDRDGGERARLALEKARGKE